MSSLERFTWTVVYIGMIVMLSAHPLIRAGVAMLFDAMGVRS